MHVLKWLKHNAEDLMNLFMFLLGFASMVLVFMLLAFIAKSMFF